MLVGFREKMTDVRVELEIDVRPLASIPPNTSAMFGGKTGRGSDSWYLRPPQNLVSMWCFTWETVHERSTRLVSH